MNLKDSIFGKDFKPLPNPFFRAKPCHGTIKTYWSILLSLVSSGVLIGASVIASEMPEIGINIFRLTGVLVIMIQIPIMIKIWNNKRGPS